MFITRAMDYFDVEDEHGRDEHGQNPSLSRALSKVRSRVCVVSFTSDWLFPTAESRAVVRALLASHARVSFVEISSDKGHDAFLLEEPELNKTIAGFLSSSAEERQLGRPAAA
jgi:homoserine O-acetyltransferase